MRSLLTIIRYEFLMQLKSIRFKGMLALVALGDLGMYLDGIRNQQIEGSFYIREEIAVFYLVAIVFAGLFSIGRIRTTGMHSILMVKPFPTFSLILGQILAAILSLLIPLCLWLFPSGLLLRYQYNIEFPIPPLGYTILFLLVPAGLGVLAVTLWVRACFKNNLVSIILLVGAFAGFTYLANSRWLNVQGPVGKIHHFVPFVSYFSDEYLRSVKRLAFDQPRVRFFRAEDWINLGSSILYCLVFVVLSSYHLRRTEPQRKVLGDYGRHWYEAPTFARMICDLKIDPHVRWGQHALLAGFIGLILVRSVWPLLAPAVNNLRAAADASVADRGASDEKKRYDLNQYTDDRLLKVKIRKEDLSVTPARFEDELTLVVDGPTSSTMAVIPNWALYQYRPERFTLDGRKLAHVGRNSYYFIEGREFEAATDGREHTLRIEGSSNPAASAQDQDTAVDAYGARGFWIAAELVHSNDPLQKYTSPKMPPVDWPVSLKLEISGRSRLIDAPVAPEVKIDGDKTAYRFLIPPDRNSMRARIFFDRYGELRTCELREAGITLRLVVDSAYEKVATELLELARPVVGEFARTQGIDWAEPIVILPNSNYPQREFNLKEIRRFYKIAQVQGRIEEWRRGQLNSELGTIEALLLERIYSADVCGVGPTNYWNFWDLQSFMKNNLKHGLNVRMSRERSFQSLEFSPIPSHVNLSSLMEIKDGLHDDLIERDKLKPPIFQMLYLVLGHERWVEMMQKLKNEARHARATPAMLQRAAESVADEKLDWFFDFWFGSAAGFPAYRVNRATASMRTSEKDESTYYEVEAEIENVGVGRMLVPVQLATSKQTVDDRLWIGSGETVTWRTTCRDLPTKVVVDPDQWIMAAPWWDEDKQAWIADFSSVVDVQATGP